MLLFSLLPPQVLTENVAETTEIIPRISAPMIRFCKVFCFLTKLAHKFTLISSQLNISHPTFAVKTCANPETNLLQQFCKVFTQHNFPSFHALWSLGSLNLKTHKNQRIKLFQQLCFVFFYSTETVRISRGSDLKLTTNLYRKDQSFMGI